jgi:UDP-N-acetyl-D-galactosamine dehydrogenase
MKRIAIIGLGYVGLPLAIAFSKKYKVVGFDINDQRIKELNRDYDRTLEIESNLLTSSKSNLRYTSNSDNIKDCDIYIITVPTPIDGANQPDLSPLISSSTMVGQVLNQGDIVIYESTVYPGVTEDICVPMLEKASNLKFNKDFFCGYSPERINPGDKEHTVTKILKVTSGSTPEIAKQVDDLYNQVITAGTYLASSIKVAEASKVIENTQRDVNIAMINELALIFNQMGIDTNEVLNAAATKWNFIKLTPGLVGGHCIGVDPYYLTFKAEELGYQPNLILAARQINNGMGRYIAEQTVKQMILNDHKVNNANVLILGITFKEDCPDMRNTKVVDIIQEIKSYGCNVDVYDPLVNKVDIEENSKYFNKNELLACSPFILDKEYSAVIVAVAHKEFKQLSPSDFSKLGDNVVLIDVKNILKNPNWRL